MSSWNTTLEESWGDWKPTEPPRLVAAACTDGITMLVGARHYDAAMSTQLDLLGEEKAREFVRNDTQGFIDQYCRFYTREEGMKLAKENGQFKRKDEAPEHLLFSEDLY